MKTEETINEVTLESRKMHDLEMLREVRTELELAGFKEVAVGSIAGYLKWGEARLEKYAGNYGFGYRFLMHNIRGYANIRVYYFCKKEE